MKRNVLIVDDSPSLREVIRRYLSNVPGCVFFEAGDGVAAETIVQERSLLDDPIDLIMLDWMLPELPGYDLLVRLRSTKQFQKKPRIVMLTAETYPDQLEACMKYGISAYLTKPFSQQDLIEAVNTAFSKEE